MCGGFISIFRLRTKLLTHRIVLVKFNIPYFRLVAASRAGRRARCRRRKGVTEPYLHGQVLFQFLVHNWVYFHQLIDPLITDSCPTCLRRWRRSTSSRCVLLPQNCLMISNIRQFDSFNITVSQVLCEADLGATIDLIDPVTYKISPGETVSCESCLDNYIITSSIFCW